MLIQNSSIKHTHRSCTRARTHTHTKPLQKRLCQEAELILSIKAEPRDPGGASTAHLIKGTETEKIASPHVVSSGESQETSVETKISLLLGSFYPMEHFYK